MASWSWYPVEFFPSHVSGTLCSHTWCVQVGAETAPCDTVAVCKRHVGAPCASDTWQDLQKGLAFRAVMVPHCSRPSWCFSLYTFNWQVVLRPCFVQGWKHSSLLSGQGFGTIFCCLHPFGSQLKPRASSLEKYLNAQDCKGNQLF